MLYALTTSPSPSRAVAYRIADNGTHDYARWNDPELVKLLEQLKKEDALDGVGYSEDDLEVVLKHTIISVLLEHRV